MVCMHYIYREGRKKVTSTGTNHNQTLMHLGNLVQLQNLGGFCSWTRLPRFWRKEEGGGREEKGAPVMLQNILHITVLGHHLRGLVQYFSSSFLASRSSSTTEFLSAATMPFQLGLGSTFLSQQVSISDKYSATG